MFFEFFNTLPSFQKYINNMFAEKPDIFINIYLDDILVFLSRNLVKHI